MKERGVHVGKGGAPRKGIYVGDAEWRDDDDDDDGWVNPMMMMMMMMIMM